MNVVYQEKLFSGLLTVIPGVLGLAVLGVFVYGQGSDIFSNPTAKWYFLGTGLFVLLAAINFAFLNIRVSYSGTQVRFGLFSHFTPASDIDGSYLDRQSSVSYGGFGIRFASVNGKRRLVYNVTNAPRVVIKHRENPDREFVFSTRNPDAVMQAIGQISGTPSRTR